MSRTRLVPAAALAGALLALLLVLSPWSSQDGVLVHATFDAVPGLVEGAEVRAGGLQVGTVTDIALRDERPRVTMRLHGDYRLRRGATADLRIASLSGSVNRVIAVTAGTGPLLPDGATLGTARTDQPVEIDDVLATLDPATRGEARALLRGLRGATDGRGPDLATALRRSARALGGTADVLAEVTADGEALRTLVRSGSRISTRLAGARGSTGAAVDELGGLLADTAAEEEALARAVTDLPDGLRAPRRALDRLAAATPGLRAVVRDAGPGVRELRGAAPELRGLLTTARPVLADAARLTATAPADLRRLGGLLPTARTVLTELDPVLTRANPIGDQARVRLPDFFSFFANWADFTSNYDANGHGARVGLVFPPAPLNRIDGDDARPGHLQAPFLRTPGVLADEPWREHRDTFVGSGGR